MFDAFNKKPIVEAQITLKDTKKKTKVQKYSDKNGACKIEHAPITFGLLSIQKEGYLLIKEEIDPSHLKFA